MLRPLAHQEVRQPGPGAWTYIWTYADADGRACAWPDAVADGWPDAALGSLPGRDESSLASRSARARLKGH